MACSALRFVIPKGANEQVRASGLAAFRQSLHELAPELGDRVDELRDWEQVKLLTVQANRLRRWYRPGLLCIGDAAHAMAPNLGQGANSALVDAAALASALARAADLPAALQAYDQRRRPRVQKVQATARQMSRSS